MTLVVIALLMLPVVMLLGIYLGRESGLRNGMARALNLFPEQANEYTIAAWKHRVIEDAGLDA